MEIVMMTEKKFDPDRIINYNVDYYAVLGLEKGCLPPSTKENRDDIARILSEAYSSSALASHPSIEGGSTEAFKLVVRAHTILSDELLRRCYDSGGVDRPRSVEDAAEYEIDWDKLGNYRKGTTADTIGFGLFFQVSDQATELGLIPAFYPEHPYHSYEWDWVIKDTEDKLSIALVPDEDEVLRLTSGETVAQSLPFKIYICIPRNHLYFKRDDTQQVAQSSTQTDVIKSRIVSASYSDYNLKETTILDEAVAYLSDHLPNDLASYRDGTLVQRQFEQDVAEEQNQWLETSKSKEHDLLVLKAIMRSKSVVTKTNPHGADFLEGLKNRQ